MRTPRTRPQARLGCAALPRRVPCEGSASVSRLFLGGRIIGSCSDVRRSVADPRLDMEGSSAKADPRRESANADPRREPIAPAISGEIVNDCRFELRAAALASLSSAAMPCNREMNSKCFNASFKLIQDCNRSL